MAKYEVRKVKRRVHSFIYDATDAEHAERMFKNGDRPESESENDEDYFLGARQVGEHGRRMVPAIHHIDGNSRNNDPENLEIVEIEEHE